MYATIEGSGRSWTVNAGNRKFSGFGSYLWAAVFCENYGLIVWTDPDA